MAGYKTVCNKTLNVTERLSFSNPAVDYQPGILSDLLKMRALQVHRYDTNVTTGRANKHS